MSEANSQKSKDCGSGTHDANCSIPIDTTASQASLFPELQPSDDFDVNRGITITGSRDIEKPEARLLLEKYLRPYLATKRHWLIGGARGLDQWAIEWLLDHQEVCCVVVPFMAKDQPKSVQPLLAKATRLVELRLQRSKHAYIQRNRFMVDRSSIVIGFLCGKKGGTYSTLQYALGQFRETHVYHLQ